MCRLGASYAGTNSTPDSTIASLRLDDVMVAGSRSPSFQMLACSVSPGTPHPRNVAIGMHPAHVAVEQVVHDRLACDPVGAQAIQDRTRKARRRSEFRIGVQRIAVAAQPVQQGLLRKIGSGTSTPGARSGGETDVDGPRSPPNPPSPRAKIDRFVFHNGLPSGSVTDVSLTLTAALPLSHTSVNRVTDRADPLAGSGPGTVTASLACSTLEEFDVDTRGTAPPVARSGGSSPPHCRKSATPAACRR
jgi:hypothetical protein